MNWRFSSGILGILTIVFFAGIDDEFRTTRAIRNSYSSSIIPQSTVGEPLVARILVVEPQLQPGMPRAWSRGVLNTLVLQLVLAAVLQYWALMLGTYLEVLGIPSKNVEAVPLYHILVTRGQPASLTQTRLVAMLLSEGTRVDIIT